MTMGIADITARYIRRATIPSAASCPHRAAAARSRVVDPLPDTIVAAQHRSSRGFSMTSNVRASFVATLRYVRASRSARSRKMRRPWRAEDRVPAAICLDRDRWGRWRHVRIRTRKRKQNDRVKFTVYL